MSNLPAESVDSICVDPPYGISLGGNPWDSFGGPGQSASEAFERWTSRWANEAARVLKPGGHLVAFGAPRTFHRLISGVEATGLEIRDQLMWLFAQGMPKSRRLPGGRGTALKPAYEPILLARKPLLGTTPENLARFGAGALNIEAARVNGYWPANVVLSHPTGCGERCAADCPAALLEQQGDGLSRMFFCAKATRAEREAGLERFPRYSSQLYTGSGRPARIRANVHPTVKPLGLLRQLVKLITPAGGIVLDPFCGSGSTGAAALLEGRRFLGIEREPGYVDIACARLTHWAAVRGTGDGTAMQGSGSPLKHTSMKGGLKEGGSNAKRKST